MIPDLSVLWVVFFVLLLVVVLDRLLFRPVLRVIGEREQAIASARELARRAGEQVTATRAEVDTQVQAARAEVYRQMEDRRRASLDRRSAMLASTRAEVETSLQQAVTRVKQQATEAKQRLTAEAEQHAAAIVERVLGRRVS